MTFFLMGLISAWISFSIFYAYMTPLKRVWFNDHVIGPWLDLVTWLIPPLLAFGTNGSIALGFGTSIGFSTIFFMFHFIHVRFPSKTRLRVYGVRK